MAAFSNINELWAELFPNEKYQLMQSLIEKVVIYNDKLQLELRTAGMNSLVHDLMLLNAQPA